MQSLQITVLQILWGSCSEQRAQVKYKPSGLFGNACVGVTAALMSRVNHSQLFNNEGGRRGRQEGLCTFCRQSFAATGMSCVGVTTCQLGGHKFPIQILLLQRLLLLPRDPAEICKARLQHVLRRVLQKANMNANFGY